MLSLDLNELKNMLIVNIASPDIKPADIAAYSLEYQLICKEKEIIRNRVRTPSSGWFNRQFDFIADLEDIDKMMKLIRREKEITEQINVISIRRAKNIEEIKAILARKNELGVMHQQLVDLLNSDRERRIQLYKESLKAK